MSTLYELLVPWCQQHPGTDEERLASFRTLASVLTAEEYATVRATLDAAAAQSVLVADMVAMLKLPGDENGNGGGIDMGNAAVRAMCDSLFTPMVAGKMKSVAERLISQTEEWGVEVTNGHLASARQLEGN